MNPDWKTAGTYSEILYQKADGIAKIKVKLPDSLTVFKLRAVAISGPDRFGFATGEMLIRQELVAQPALPRFVRPSTWTVRRRLCSMQREASAQS